jgi:hypothetical protein
MQTEPVGQIAAADPAGGEIEHKAFLFIHRGIDLGSVKKQEGFHGSMPRALVAVDEWVTANQREAQGGSLLNQRRIQVGAAESGLGWATVDSSAAKSRIPGAPPVAWRTRR